MSIFKLLWSFFFWIVFQIFFFVIFVISFLLALLGDFGGQILYFTIKIALRILFFVFFIQGKVSLTEEKAVYVSNMSTIFDPLFYIAYFPGRLRFVVDSKMFRIPFLGWLMKIIECIPAPIKKEDYFIFAKLIASSLPVLVFRGSAGLLEIGEIKTIPILILGSEKVISAGLVTPGEVKIVKPNASFLAVDTI